MSLTYHSNFYSATQVATVGRYVGNAQRPLHESSYPNAWSLRLLQAMPVAQTSFYASSVRLAISAKPPWPLANSAKVPRSTMAPRDTTNT